MLLIFIYSPNKNMITPNVSIVRVTIFISGLNNEKVKIKKASIYTTFVLRLALSSFCLVNKMNISNTNLPKHPGLSLIIKKLYEVEALKAARQYIKTAKKIACLCQHLAFNPPKISLSEASGSLC